MLLVAFVAFFLDVDFLVVLLVVFLTGVFFVVLEVDDLEVVVVFGTDSSLVSTSGSGLDSTTGAG